MRWRSWTLPRIISTSSRVFRSKRRKIETVVKTTVVPMPVHRLRTALSNSFAAFSCFLCLLCFSRLACWKYRCQFAQIITSSCPSQSPHSLLIARRVTSRQWGSIARVVSVKLSSVKPLERNLDWDQLEWGPSSVRIRGKEYQLHTVQFRPIH